MKNMTQGSPARVIVQFLIPVLTGNLLQLAYSITDTRIVGSFLGDAALAAVGSTTVLHSLYNGLFMGIANGFAIMTAQLFGAKKLNRVRSSFAASLFLGAIVAVLLVSATLAMMNPLLRFLNVPAELLPTSGAYIRIIVAGMLVTMMYDVLLTSARAIGDSVTPLLILILSVGLNIAGDLVLLGVFHTSVRGAAAATVLAQAIALSVCAVYLLRKYEFFRVKKEDFHHIEWPMAKEMLATGFSMGMMSSLVSMGSLILQTAINDLGSSYIVAQTAARKVTEVMMSIFVAMGQTMATYCGQNFGAGEYRRIRKGMNFAYLLTCSWCAVVLMMDYLFAPQMVRMVTGSDDMVMIHAASLYLRVDCILYVLVAIIFVQRNTLQGIGERVTPMISSGIEMVGKLILTYSLVPHLGYMGVILVEPIVWIVMIIPLIRKVREYTRREEWQN